MCSGGGGGGDNGAQQQAEARQRELQRIARERKALAATQMAQMQAMKNQQQLNESQQRNQAAQLGAEQQRRLGGIEAQGRAASSSLFILSGQEAKAAPSATQSKELKAGRGAKTTTAGLRIGSGGYGAGSGANIAV